MKPDITQDRLKQLLYYNPDTGVFTRLTKWGSKDVGDVPGSRSPQGYWYIGVDSKIYPSHRLAWLYTHGEMPNGDIDHINRDRLDNRIVNLRVTTRSTNVHNSPHRNPASKIKGVYRTKENHWQASIKVASVTYRLGTYKTVEDAADARKFAEQLLIPA